MPLPDHQDAVGEAQDLGQLGETTIIEHPRRAPPSGRDSPWPDVDAEGARRQRAGAAAIRGDDRLCCLRRRTARAAARWQGPEFRRASRFALGGGGSGARSRAARTGLEAARGAAHGAARDDAFALGSSEGGRGGGERRERAAEGEGLAIRRGLSRSGRSTPAMIARFSAPAKTRPEKTRTSPLRRELARARVRAQADTRGPLVLANPLCYASPSARHARPPHARSCLRRHRDIAPVAPDRAVSQTRNTRPSCART